MTFFRFPSREDKYSPEKQSSKGSAPSFLIPLYVSSSPCRSSQNRPKRRVSETGRRFPYRESEISLSARFRQISDR